MRMIAVYRTVVLSIGLQLAVNACGWAQGGGGDHSSIPAEVLSALRSHGRQLSPISVTWVRQFKSVGRSDTAALALLKMEHRDAERFFAVTNHTVKWQDGKLYDWRERPNPGGGRAVNETAFDGSVRYLGQLGGRHKTLGKRFMTALQDRKPTAQVADTTYFEYAGVHVPNIVGDFADPTTRSLILHFLASAGELVAARSVQGSTGEQFVIEIVSDNDYRLAAQNIDLGKLRDELAYSTDTEEGKAQILSAVRQARELPEKVRHVFYLDPSYRYAVRIWERWYGTERLTRRAVCDEFIEVGGRGIWVPKEIAVTFYEFSSRPGVVWGEPVLMDTFVVTDLDAGSIPDDQFVLNYTEPGTMILDGTSEAAARSPDGQVTYRIPASLEDLGDRARRIQSTRNWLVIVNVVAAVALCVVFVVRKMRTRRGR